MKILALDVGGTVIKSAIIDEDGSLHDIRSTPSSPQPAELLTQCAIAVAKQYTSFDVLAVAMTGQIDHKTQTTLSRNNGKCAERAQFPVGKVFSEAVLRPTFVLNDANAAALAEATQGAGKGHPDFLCLTYGTGVGGGIIQNGQLLTGNRGIAGEFGHIVTHVGGRRCRCGRRGCYQEYASTTALLREARRHYPELHNARELFDRLPEEPALQKVTDKWIREIVEGLCSLTYIFNPACFVLGGGVMERDDVLEKVRQQFLNRVMSSFSDVEILKAELGNHAGMIGAAIFARKALEDNHLEVESWTSRN